MENPFENVCSQAINNCRVDDKISTVAHISSGKAL